MVDVPMPRRKQHLVISSVQKIATLVRKEFSLELRRKSVLSGIGLYLLSLVFICYLTFRLQQGSMGNLTWSALFWLIILFAIVNSAAKSFIGERPGVQIYLYSLASPQMIILSKMIYSALLGILLVFMGYGLFVLFMTDPVADHPVFITGMLLAAIGLSVALSFISALASRAQNSNVLMAVLSFPVVLAVLLLAIRITKNALDGLDASASYDEMWNLLAINSISVALAYLLFPYIWRS
jgi:heme exporter protein B